MIVKIWSDDLEVGWSGPDGARGEVIERFLKEVFEERPAGRVFRYSPESPKGASFLVTRWGYEDVTTKSVEHMRKPAKPEPATFGHVALGGAERAVAVTISTGAWTSLTAAEAASAHGWLGDWLAWRDSQ